MQNFLINLLCIVALILLLSFAIWPNRRNKKEAKKFCGLCFAHRGLWSKPLAIPENSMRAFQRAVDSGYAIELDVHLTSDGKAVIFHDDNAKRMCKRNAWIWDLTYAQLAGFTLSDTDEKIPLLSEVLKMVDGHVPLLIELKAHGRSTAICETVAPLLAAYQGSYCIESFSPFILRWYKKHRPEVVRGQLSCRFKSSVAYPGIIKWMGEYLLFNWMGRPDFIAYEYHRGMRMTLLRWLRRFLGTPIFVWTIHSKSAHRKSRLCFDSIIFDRYRPGQRDFSTKE